MSDEQFADPNESDKAVLDYLNDLLSPGSSVPDDAPPESAGRAFSIDARQLAALKIQLPAAYRPRWTQRPQSQVAQARKRWLRNQQGTKRVKPKAKAFDHNDILLDLVIERPQESRQAAEASTGRQLPALRAGGETVTPRSKIPAKPLKLAPKPNTDPIGKPAKLTVAEPVAPKPIERAGLLVEPKLRVKPSPARTPESEKTAAKPALKEAIQPLPVVAEQKITKAPVPPVSKATPQSAGKVSVGKTGPVARQRSDTALIEDASALADGQPPNGWDTNGRPHWAQNPFECLLFKVAGLKLAVPLITLGGVHSLDKPLTPLFGMPKWFCGLFQYDSTNYKVIDSALWVMPDKYSAQWLETMHYVVCLQDTEWALGCTAIDTAFRLKPDQVKWRSERSKRPWLAGTVVTQMCALIDVDGLLSIVGEAANRRAK